MILLPLLVAAIGGGIFAWAARTRGRAGTWIGLGALLAVLVLAWRLPTVPTDTLLAGEPVGLGAYARITLGAAAATGLLLTLLRAALPAAPDGAREPDPAPAFLLYLGAATLGLAVVSPVVALLPAAAAGLGGFVAVGRIAPVIRRGGRMDDTMAEVEAGMVSRRLGADLFRVGLALVVVVTAVEVLVGLADVVAGEPFGVGAATLGIALAATLRVGAVPFHGHAIRLAEHATRSAVPILLLWGPALFALASLAAFQAAVLPIGLPLSVERGVIAGVAVLTIVAGGLGSLVQDDLDHVVAYWILQDVGIAILAFAAADGAVWGPARAWLLLLPLTKTALLAWTLTVSRTFSTRSLLELRGWARRAPFLAVALVLIELATVGLPGTAALDARVGLLQGAFSEPIRTLVLIASLTSVVVVVRILLVGTERPTGLVEAAPDERLRRPLPDLRRRVGTTAALTWHLNRAPLSALLVVAAALLSVSLAAGLFGFRGAAASNVPAELPALRPTTITQPTFQPIATVSPTSGSPSPDATTVPSDAPSATP